MRTTQIESRIIRTIIVIAMLLNISWFIEQAYTVPGRLAPMLDWVPIVVLIKTVMGG